MTWSLKESINVCCITIYSKYSQSLSLQSVLLSLELEPASQDNLLRKQQMLLWLNLRLLSSFAVQSSKMTACVRSIAIHKVICDNVQKNALTTAFSSFNSICHPYGLFSSFYTINGTRQMKSKTFRKLLIAQN